MNFKVVKKGYDQTQVNEYIQNITNENNEVVTNLKTEIEELKRQQEELKQVVAGYEKKKEEIFVAFVEAQENAAQLKEKAEKRFADEMERLQLFQQKWTSYAKKVSKSLAPEQVEKFEQASRKFDEILSLYDKGAKVLVPQEVVQIQQDKTFDPLKKVAKFLNNFDNQQFSTPPTREEQQISDQIVQQATVINEVHGETEKVNEPLKVESLAEKLAEVIDSAVVKAVEKQDDDNAKQLLQEDNTASKTEENDISQSDILNVQQSLEDLCKELGLIE